MTVYTLETLKEWHDAGARGQSNDIKRRLKALLKIDPNPKLGETHPIQNDYGYASPPEPALIFKSGTFEARVCLYQVDEFLSRNGYTPQTPHEWLKENLLGTQGKFLLTGKGDLYLTPINDTSAHVSDGKTIVRVSLKSPIPEKFVDTKVDWPQHIQVNKRIALVNRKEFHKLTQVFNKERSLTICIESDVIKVESSDKYSDLKGTSELPALTEVPCTLKVDPKTLNNILKNLKDEEVSLFINETCLSLNSEAFLAHWNNYPEFPKPKKEATNND